MIAGRPWLGASDKVTFLGTLNLYTVVSKYSLASFSINDDKEFLTKEKIPVNNVSKHHHPILEYFFDASNEIGIKKNTNLNNLEYLLCIILKNLFIIFFIFISSI